MTKLNSRPRVVVIDDEPIVADTLAEILVLHGYEAKAFYNGESAVADMKQFRPEVILSDVCMPGIDGIETALKIREYDPQCRVILFTASPVRRNIYERIRDLEFEFLERPLHPWDVLVLLRTHERNRPTGLLPEAMCRDGNHQCEPSSFRGPSSLSRQNKIIRTTDDMDALESNPPHSTPAA